MKLFEHLVLWLLLLISLCSCSIIVLFVLNILPPVNLPPLVPLGINVGIAAWLLLLCSKLFIKPEKS